MAEGAQPLIACVINRYLDRVDNFLSLIPSITTSSASSFFPVVGNADEDGEFTSHVAQLLLMPAFNATFRHLPRSSCRPTSA